MVKKEKTPTAEDTDSLVYFEGNSIKLREEINWLNIRKIAKHLQDFADKHHM
jgi:hypothetical protein